MIAFSTPPLRLRVSVCGKDCSVAFPFSARMVGFDMATRVKNPPNNPSSHPSLIGSN
jgi:hypothetical protein